MPMWRQDAYNGGEALEDVTGDDTVKTYDFSTEVHLVVVEAKGVNQVARADPFGGTPSATRGVVCDDAIPTFMPIATARLKIFAPSGMVVSVWGYRYKP